MIHFLVGKPRNGKTLRAMMHVWEQLTTTTRHVVTNMVIDIDRLQALLIERGFPHIDARARVRMLNDEQTRDFWLYWGFGYDLPKCDRYDDAKADTRLDFGPLFENERFWKDRDTTNPESLPVMHGVCYIIDECHTIWPARGWKGTPRHADFFNSQHGKLNCIIFFITQNTKLVDTNFLRLAQDFTYCRNHRLEKHGRFRGDDKFTAHTYPGPISSDKEPTLNKETYRLDKTLASCYDTSAGVGMPGGGAADAGYRAKGIPLKMVWVGLGVFLVLCWLGMTYGIPMLTNRFIAPVIDPAAKGKKQAPGSTAAPAVVASDPVPSSTPEISAKPEHLVPAVEVFPTGVAMSSRRVFVQMSDGTRRVWLASARGSSDSITSITPSSVTVDGKKMFIRPTPRLGPMPIDPAAAPVAGEPSSGEVLPAPPAAPPSSWRMHSDGVQRLVGPEVIGR
ncbi:MAG TPA: zonular occludens toxin domain-containing protein [Roseimicrobium sp.]|nr:zonular occludens toxin domain-containing protein [Roseimicrobium sp.]